MSDGWKPLPADVAEWMGMDEAMVPLLLALTDSQPRIVHGDLTI